MLNQGERMSDASFTIVETVIEQLKSICHIEHSRHRSPVNFITNLVGDLAAYALKSRKPEIKINKMEQLNPQLIHN